MKSLLICGLILLAFSFKCNAITPTEIGGEYGHNILSIISNQSIANYNTNNSDLWRWGGSPMGFGQLFPGQGLSNDFGGWAPNGENPLRRALNETAVGYTINKTKSFFEGQEYLSNDSTRLFPGHGFYNDYGGWEPIT